MAFVLLGETSSMGLRAHTTALATATQSILGIVMNIAIPYMVNPDEANLKGKVGFVFGGLAAIATFGSWLYVPELKGRTNREIDIVSFPFQTLQVLFADLLVVVCSSRTAKEDGHLSARTGKCVSDDQCKKVMH